jgi:hypothetical protein
MVLWIESEHGKITLWMLEALVWYRTSDILACWNESHSPAMEVVALC